jgi:peroxiredoxin
MNGWRSPAVSAPDQFGQEVNMKTATSGPWAVVFFYPKADTPG